MVLHRRPFSILYVSIWIEGYCIKQSFLIPKSHCPELTHIKFICACLSVIIFAHFSMMDVMNNYWWIAQELRKYHAEINKNSRSWAHGHAKTPNMGWFTCLLEIHASTFSNTAHVVHSSVDRCKIFHEHLLIFNAYLAHIQRRI